MFGRSNKSVARQKGGRQPTDRSVTRPERGRQLTDRCVMRQSKQDNLQTLTRPDKKTT